jgi:GH15 family glucan-1,4-alpha-glucosidase
VDCLPDGEGSFTACSFWFVECLARAGQSEKAQLLLEKLWATPITLHCANGNFTQAFRHLALISAATYLDRILLEKGDGVWR